MITFLRWLHVDDTITYSNLTLEDIKPLFVYAAIALPSIPSLIRFLANF